MFGIINCYKRRGESSRDVVSAVSKALNEKRIGHAGTLDPLAEGVLLLAVGRATRLVPYLQELSKRYLATFQLGLESATQDITGDCTVVPIPPFSKLDLERISQEFVGDIQQVPPIYSAIRVNGRRAYRLARKGRVVQIESRPVRVDSINIVKFETPTWTMEVSCGKGTYIRTIGHEMARRMGTAAVMTSLTRTAIGCFSVDESLTVEQIIQGNYSIMNPICAFEGWRRLDLDGLQVERLSFGHRPEWSLDQKRAIVVGPDQSLVAVIERSKSGEFRFVANFVGRG